MDEINHKQQCREDFALTAVPSAFERPSVGRLFGIILAIPSALIFLSVGGALESAYGTMTLITGLVVAAVIIGVVAWILTTFASQTGLDSDLMSICAGFGATGSAITSGIYSMNFLILFALEDVILASAVSARFPAIPHSVVFVGLGILVLFMTWRGITSLAVAMKLSLPVLATLLIVTVFRSSGHHNFASFLSYNPSGRSVTATAWLSVLAALLAFIVNATVAADVGRFIRPKQRKIGTFLFSVVLQVVCFGMATIFGAWLTYSLDGNTNPGIYLVTLLGGWGVIFVMLSQMRINAINAYSGSLSLSNFGARGLGIRPGRHIWMVILVVGATLLAMTNIYQHLLGVLTFEAVFVIGWVATLVSYIVYYDLRNRTVEELTTAPRINIVGLGALAASLAVATPLTFGIAGELGKALAPLVAIVLAPSAVVLIDRLLLAVKTATSSA